MMGRDAFMAFEPPRSGARSRTSGAPDSGRSRAANLDLSRLQRFHLRQVQDEHAVLALRADLAGVDRLMNGEDTVEVADTVLVQQERVGTVPRLHPRVQEQLALLVTQVHVFRTDAGQVRVQDQLA